MSRKRSHAQMEGGDDDAADDDEDNDAEEDDLYGGGPETAQKSASTSTAAISQPISAYNFHVIDRLPSMGPINDFCFGKSSKSSQGSLDALASVGRGREAGLHSSANNCRLSLAVKMPSMVRRMFGALQL